MTASTLPSPMSGPVSVDATVERLRRRARGLGTLVMGGFGVLWSAVGLALCGAPAWAWAGLALLAAAFGVAGARLMRGNAPDDRPVSAELAALRQRSGRLFAWTSVGEGLGIFLAVNVVANLGHPQWQPAAAMLVVGLHFFPLTAAFGYRPHLVTGAAMTAWALAYPWLFAAGAMAPAGMLGAGAILFASAGWAWRSAGQNRK